MQFILTFVFLSLFILFLYGFFTYYNKKKHLPYCDIIYILDDGIKDDHKPDFDQAKSNYLYNLSLKKEHRLKQGLDIFWE